MMKRLLALAVMALLPWAASAQTVVSFNFGDLRGHPNAPNQGPAGGDYALREIGAPSFAGVAPYNAQNWNNVADLAGVNQGLTTANLYAQRWVPGTGGASFIDSTGAAIVGMTIQVSATGGVVTQQNTGAADALSGDNTMMRSSVGAFNAAGNGPVLTIAITNVPLALFPSGYDVVVYYTNPNSGGGGENTRYSVGVPIAIATPPSNGFGAYDPVPQGGIEPGNYTVFGTFATNNVTIDAQSLVGGGLNGQLAAISGIQLVPTAVPEPTTLACIGLIGASSVGYFRYRRRQKQLADAEEETTDVVA